ncbi:EEF1A lysine methyltransferase 2 isoform X1 [Nematostella vectensis]|uniref:EEF1A lysine methyltransferase 2 isoform X1 n=1 Tax=Nematostella vectensis TaxID=45351 RepID=UPI002076F0F7|nr:EEF1A lysine methyltransferase 2 isoform X1 [Nematostella vectensis]
MADEEVETNNGTLPPSELGTKQYWDSAYETELSNFDDHGDVGEIWFGEGCLNRMIKWIKKCPRITKNSSILDVGCGNGMLLVPLAQDNYKDLLGIDYSAAAIKLAISVAEQESVNIKFMECDILELRGGPLEEKTFDMCLDKGTYDAISLNPDDSLACRQKYIKSVSELLRPHALLVITSCNWTKSELIKQFQNEFHFLEEIPAPTFSFGGGQGHTATSVVFEKQRRD